MWRGCDGAVTERGPGGEALSVKIERLFQTVRPEGGREPYSNKEVAQACQEASGETFSSTYIWQLRTGRRDNPTKRHLEALAQFFDVPPAYFFNDEQGAAITRELELLGAFRDAGVRDIALRAVHLSPEWLDMLNGMIDTITRKDADRNPPPQD